MAYKSKKVATCFCGDGDGHSLRTSGICGAVRAGTLDAAFAQTLLAKIRGGNADDKRRKGENTNASTPVVQPEGAV